MDTNSDIKAIKNEDWLKKMWQQTEDSNRRKEIHSHLYKLRESRLRDLYQEGSEIMAQHPGAGFGKDPLTPCHGDSLIDQSFQSLKSKEVRDSTSPTHDMKFHSLSLNQPNTTGWDVQTSSEVSPDGRAFRSETLAKTDGVEKINGGVAEFQGRNEQRSSATHEGDDKNFVKKASESSKTHLQENVVIGDENSGRTEIKSSSKTSSSSQVISSSSTVYHDSEPQEINYLMDQRNQQEQYEKQFRQQQELHHQQRQQQQQQQQHHQQQQLQKDHKQVRKTDQAELNRQYQTTEQYNRNKQETSSSTQVETDTTYEENKRYIDMDKASPEYQQRVQFLMAQPGEVISNTVEYPKPNVKMITTVKRLPDGTIVKNKRYETEELRPTADTTHQRQAANQAIHSNTQTERKTERSLQDQENIYTRLQNTRNPESTRRVSPTDSVDNVERLVPTSGNVPPRNISDSQSVNTVIDDVSNIATYSSVQKSSRRFSTETTSETVEEVEDHPSTYQLPNVVKNIRSGQEPQAFTTHGFPSVRANKSTQEYPNERPQIARNDNRNISVRPTHEGPQKPNRPEFDFPQSDVVVMSETKTSSKHKTNSERIVQTEISGNDDYTLVDKINLTEMGSKPDFQTHGFPSVKESSPLREGSPQTFYPSSPRQAKLHENSYSTNGFPSVKSPNNTNNRETPVGRYPNAKEVPIYVERQTPSTSSPSQAKPKVPTSSVTSTKKEKTSTESTHTVRKEKEVDAAHRAFAASLRSSSPIDNTRRDSYTTDQQRYTPRSSIASSKTTNRRDMREGSHDSNAASETSRISTSTVTRHSPGKSVGKTTPLKQPSTRVSETPQRLTKSPSPSKTITTTTTIKKTAVDVPKADNQINKTAASNLSINEPLTITKTQFSDTDSSFLGNEVVEEPCIKKQFYKLGPSDNTTTPPAVEKSSLSPTFSSHKPRTHSTNKSPVDDDLSDQIDDIFEVDVTDIEQFIKKPINNKSPNTLNRKVPKDATDTYIFRKDTTFEKPDDKEFDQVPKEPFNKTSKHSKTPKNQEIVSEYSSASNTLVHSEINKTNDLIWQTNRHSQPNKNIKSIAVEFIAKESEQKSPSYNNETPDGALSSKEHSPSNIKETHVPTSPTYKKKGLSRSETFEERCRQILGMEDSGDTQGTYSPCKDLEPNKSKPTKQDQESLNIQKESEIEKFQVRVEDCEDDEPNFISELSIRRVDLPSNKFVDKTEINVSTDKKNVNKANISSTKSQSKPISSEPLDFKPSLKTLPSENIHLKTTYQIEKTTKTQPSAPFEPEKTHSEQPTQTPKLEKNRPYSPERKHSPARANPTKPDNSMPTDQNLPITKTNADNETPCDGLSPMMSKHSTKLPENQRFPKTTRMENVHNYQELTDQHTQKTTASFYLIEAPNDNQRTTSPDRKHPGENRSPQREPSPDHKYLPENNRTHGPRHSPTPQRSSIKEISTKLCDTNTKETDDKTNSYSNTHVPREETTTHRSKSPENQDVSQKPTDEDTLTDNDSEDSLEKEQKVVRNIQNNEAEHIFHETLQTTHISLPERKYSPEDEHLPKPERKQAQEQIRTNSQERKHSPEPQYYPVDKNLTYCKPENRERQNAPQHNYSPEDTYEPEREYSPVRKNSSERKFSPERKHSVPRKLTPDRHHSPEHTFKSDREYLTQRKHSPERKNIPESESYPDETERKFAPEKKFEQEVKPFPSAPVVKHAPERKHPPERQHSPVLKNLSERKHTLEHKSLHEYSLERNRSREDKYAPELKHSPERQHSTERRHLLQRKHSPERQYSSDEKHFPEHKYSPERKHCPHRKHSPEGKNFPQRKHSPESMHSPDQMPKKNARKFLPDNKHSSVSKVTCYDEPGKKSPSTILPISRSSNPHLITSTQPSSNKPVKKPIKESITEEKVPPKTVVKSKERIVNTNVNTVLNKRDDFKSLKKISTVNAIGSKSSESHENKPRKPFKKSGMQRKPTENPSDDESNKSSPDVSPTRSIGRRRSSNISVHTEIVIDHQGPKSPKIKTIKTDEELINSALLHKQNKKLLVTERKESAPVHRVTRKDKDAKMSRSTSEKIIKSTIQTEKKPEATTQSPYVLSKPEKRPNKCLTTKSINLSAMHSALNTEDIESIVIDIQHAKSSREPSPDKIVPTPVPSSLDTGKPRYPDVVQEPEDEPRKKPVVKNIPIFEEDSNDFIGCQIIELNVNKETIDNIDNNDEILHSPTVEAPISLDFQPADSTEDACLLSVHDKVTKFTLTAEESKKPKTSGITNKEIDHSQRFPLDDECLLTVDQKVNKFLKTAEKITNEVNTTAKEITQPRYNKPVNMTPSEKLAATMPQRSPKLVAKVEREVSRQPDAEMQPAVEGSLKEHPSKEKQSSIPREVKKVSKSEYSEDDEVYTEETHFEEPAPMTKSHTLSIELKRQKDILGRPSVFKDKEDKPHDHIKPIRTNGTTAPLQKETKTSVEIPTRRISTDDGEEQILCKSKTASVRDNKNKLNANNRTNVASVKQKFEPSYKKPSFSRSPNTMKLNQRQTEEEYECKLTTDLSKKTYTKEWTARKSFSKDRSESPNNKPLSDNAKKPRHYSTRSTSNDKIILSSETTKKHTLNKEDIQKYEENLSNRLSSRKTISDDDRHSPMRKTQVEKPAQLHKPSIEKAPQYPVVSHSPTPSPYHTTKITSSKTTESTVEHIPSYPSSSCEDIEKILDSPAQKKPPHVTTSKIQHSTESVAARRNIFERGIANKPNKTSPAKPGTPTQQGRRPSYMDHTKSSLEHTRRDSLEINKNNYSRKTSIEEQTQYDRKPNSAVKFDIPQQKSSETDMENIIIEEIFDLYILEQMLETVTSYELRRRIRAQIRVVKKNIENLATSHEFDENMITQLHSTTRTKSFKGNEESDNSKKTWHVTHSRDRSSSPIHRKGGSTSPSSRRLSDTQEQLLTHDNRSSAKSKALSVLEQTDSVFPENLTKSTTKRNGTSAVVHTTLKTGNISAQTPSEKKEPIWMQSKNPMKKPSRSPVEKPSHNARSTSTMSSSTSTQRRNQVEDSITSSYGIGPTDENGLPLFGIKALKKKPQTQPCETTEEVTGYVVEEKFYSDNKTKPVVERKQLIYATNAEDLEEIQRKLDSEITSKDSSKKIHKKYITGVPDKILISSGQDMSDFSTSTKYVRRGSVKEMSEKLIRKESQSSIEKTSSYPKAGLILRTNSRPGDADESESIDVCKRAEKKAFDVTSSDDDFGGSEYVRTEKRILSRTTGDDNETESMNIHTETKSQKSSARSFLNSSQESKVVVGVDDALERMRNADNVVEEGDTVEDQEARALLNKFIGASVLMSGVETMLPTKQSKFNANNESFNSNKQQVKTTRVTSTFKSGSSSSPVARKTCDIEEIWDEEYLKELLEQATSYEERRKIRARLRELMAEREDCKDQGVKSELSSTQQDALESDAESNSSEYEEIIEEVTDYSDDDEKVVILKEKEPDSVVQKPLEQELSEEVSLVEIVVDEKEKTVAQVKSVTEEQQQSVDVKPQTEQNQSKAPESPFQESVEKGESLMPLLQDLLHKNMPQTEQTATQNSIVSNSIKNMNSRTSKTVESISNENSSLSVSQINTNTNTSNKSRQTNKGQTLNDGQNTVTTIGNAGSNSVLNQLSIPQREDSGTESGEDLRLIAAGIRDQLHMQTDTNLMQEVTTALNRLESSLKEGRDISLDDRKRNALLALVARLQNGLTSPEKLADATLLATDTGDVKKDNGCTNYDETSSPEADGHRSNRQRFAKRRNRNNRHTVGVSREELEDARRYMEDMLLMENISNCTTPESSITQATQPPNWFPVVKNASSGAILIAQPPSNLSRPNEFVPKSLQNPTEYNRKEQVSIRRKSDDAGKITNKRPLSGDYSVSFASNDIQISEPQHNVNKSLADRELLNRSPESSAKSNRFSNKKLLMKRANTIDIPKTKHFQHEFETDSDVEDKGSTPGLKRAVQVSVKQKVRNVVPPFEPKTENDHKFLAFINKQSSKPGLGWNNSKSVSNWTNKFGSIKNTFEVGAAASVTSGKPPQVPGHTPQNAAKNLFQRQVQQQHSFDEDYSAKARIQRGQQEMLERRRRLDKERFERERLEREYVDKLKKEHAMRERALKEHQERERLGLEQKARERNIKEQKEREYLERLRLEHQSRERSIKEQQEREYHERLRVEHQCREKAIKEQQEREYLERKRIENEQVYQTPQSMPINQFIHAPQSVFRPIDSNDLHADIFKPIPQDTQNMPHTWQSPKTKTQAIISDLPKYKLSTPQFNDSNSTSPCATSPIGLPWLSKQSNTAALKQRASRFEDNPQYEERSFQNLHRHNSLRSNNSYQQQFEPHRKRPSLPNTTEPYLLTNNYPPQGHFYSNPVYPPAPTNISFTYTDYAPPTSKNYQSYPCLPTAVSNEHQLRSREDSLTNPQAEPLVLSSSNPLYRPQVETPQSLGPNIYQRQFDYASPMDSAPTSPSFMSMHQTDCTDDELDSDSNIMEYRVESKVMARPQVQKAITIERRTNHVSDDEVYGKNSRAARSLLTTIKNLGSNNNDQNNMIKNRQEHRTSPKVCLSPDGRSYQAPMVDPLFPQLTTFESNRSPMYLSKNSPKSSSMQSLPTHYHQNPTYVPPTYGSISYQNTAPKNEKPKSIYKNQSSSTSLPNQRAPPHSSNSYMKFNSVAPPKTNQVASTMHAEEPKLVPYAATTNQQTSISNTKPELRPKPQLPPLNTSLPNIGPKTSSVLTKPHAQSQPQNFQQKQMEKQTFLQRSQTKMDEVALQRDTAQQCLKEPRLSTQQINMRNEQKQTSTELRRKSFGNVLDIEQQQRKSNLFEYTQHSKQEYKSSAPMDTPDIVKSSLPRDENAPILKKFGPPQRHHYMPNSYQSPNTSHTQTQTRQNETHTNINMSTRSIVQHSTLTNKPTIVETPSTPQSQIESTEDLIPRNIVFNNVSAFTSMSRRCSDVDETQSRPNKLSKSDSWSQIVQQQSQYTAPNVQVNRTAVAGNELRRSKSGHTLAVPKMFEAGIDKSVVGEKQKTVAAYFSGNKSPNVPIPSDDAYNSDDHYMSNTKKSTINRIKTTAKVSAASRKSLSSISTNYNGAIAGGALTRSATMPHIANLNLLDESNVEDAFEQLMLEHFTTTEKSEVKDNDGAVVTTTTKVTTRTVSQTPKPVSPFAKFKQLDKQNSLQSPKSPSTPIIPGGSTSGSAAIFKFTDPALNARAATAKEQLLQWCQIKTKEYENVQVTNFSTSWSNGLAFCALIHHFLPDAFDYSTLTPQSRKHNFELAFTVADEKAGIAPLLDVEDMVEMSRPDWKCVFVYVQSIYRRFRNCQ